MRYKPEHKEETHERIVATAARGFQEKGIDGLGIAALMKKLELTHGGFYAHFENKDDLVREAIAASFDHADREFEEAGQKGGLQGIIDIYLSPGHVDNPGFGCPVAALAPEISRQPQALAHLFMERLRQRIASFATIIPGVTDAEREELATFIFASMVGAVSMARALPDPEQRNHILASTRSQLLKLIGVKPS